MTPATKQSTAPATGEVLGVVRATPVERLPEIVSDGRDAQRGWSAAGAVQRSLAVGRLGAAVGADEGLAELIANEVGKPIREARAEVLRAAHICSYYAGVGHEFGGILRNSIDSTVAIMARRIPLGVVGVITPWNFPVAIPLWKMIPGLVSGCAVVWKPASPATLVAKRLTELIEGAGFEPDLVQAVYGDSELGSALVEQDLDAVTFTGSSGVGEQLRRRLGGAARPRLSLELGGVNVAHVLADADLPAAARDIATAAFGYAGQKCTATQVVAADAAIYGQLVDALREQLRSLVIGDPMREDVSVGPVISPHAARQIREAIARLPPPLATADASSDGAFVAPTMFQIDGPEHLLAREELFGPVLGAAAVGSDAERAELSASSGMGLCAAIYSQSADEVRRVANLVGAGVLAVNRPSTGLDPHVPFGGWGASGGDFAEQGVVALDFFSKWQTIYWKAAGPNTAFP